MRHLLSRRLTLAALPLAALPILLILSVTLPAGAQGSRAQPFVDVIDVRVVNLEVVVVDRDGRRVTGLGPEDFRLHVNKRSHPIEFFSEVSQGVAVTHRPAEKTASIPGLISGKPVGTSYLVFIDELFTLPPDRNRVLKEFIPQLWRLGPEDRMAVVAFNGRRIDMLSTWSQSARDLELAFEEAMERRTRGLVTDVILQDLEVEPFREEEVADEDTFVSQFSAKQVEDRLERIALAATATLRSFAKPPGRKVMLLLAGAWPHTFNTPTGGADLSRGGRILSPVFETANLLGYTLYPIDVEGRQEDPGRLAGADRLAAPNLANLGSELEVHTTFDVLAEETGGRPLLDGARLTAFDEVIADTRSYYWLGFTPDWQGNDKRHRIEVEVLRPGYEVRYRESFQDLSREKEVSFMVESALMFGQLPGAKPLKVQFGQPTKKRRLLVPLTLTIPMDEIAMLPVDSGRYEAHLEMRIAVLDGKGDRNEIAAVPVVLHGDRLPRPGEQAIYETSIRMRPEKHDVVVSLHDPLGGTILATVGQFVW